VLDDTGPAERALVTGAEEMHDSVTSAIGGSEPLFTVADARP
jgi:hypothetical protein